MSRLSERTTPSSPASASGRDILIIKLGATLPDLAAVLGDFEDWILHGMQLRAQDVMIANPTMGDALPSVETVSGVVITGSHAMVTEHAPWSETTAGWLRQAVDARLPILGICYGHQLLAYALGGHVADNPNGREFGTVRAPLTEMGCTDSLLGGLGPAIDVQTSHTQSVIVLPKGSRLLAASTLDPHLAFVVAGHAWGVQFHPEFSADVTRSYIRATREALLAEGRDPEAILAAVRDTPVGATILRRFAELVLARSNKARKERTAQIPVGQTGALT